MIYLNFLLQTFTGWCALPRRATQRKETAQRFCNQWILHLRRIVPKEETGKDRIERLWRQQAHYRGNFCKSCVKNVWIKFKFQLAGTIYGPYSYIEEIHPGTKNNKHVLGKAQEAHLPGTWDFDHPWNIQEGWARSRNSLGAQWMHFKFYRWPFSAGRQTQLIHQKHNYLFSLKIIYWYLNWFKS